MSLKKIEKCWPRFWMHFAGLSGLGRLATRLAAWSVPPYKSRSYLASFNSKGYIAPNASVHHNGLHLGGGVFISDRVVIYQATDGGPVDLAKGVQLHSDIIIETGEGGCLTIGAHSSIQPRCHFSAYKGPINIGKGVQIAPNCAFYSYNHGIAAGKPMREQPLQTKGGIVLDDDVWMGFGAVVLDGVRIGKGAVVGAGSVVTKDVPEGAVVAGIPARVIRMRGNLEKDNAYVGELSGHSVMKSASQPLVSVLTPVYNGEKYLSECIESVLTQTYQNWEYIIVNNCSKDRTLEIAQKYAARDKRVRIHNNDHFLNVIQNHNHAMHLISAESRYCKVLQADDWLFPECITKMVEVAEENPSVGIVGSYRLDDVRVNCDGLHYSDRVISGHAICRFSLLEGQIVFGSPSTLLIRSDLIRKRTQFYNENNLHADTEVCYDILENADFGFVHQVLSFTRRENESMTKTFALRYNSYILGDLLILKKYGSKYLNRSELEKVRDNWLKRHYRYLGKRFIKRDKEILDYHIKGLRELGVPVSFTKIVRASFVVAFNRLLDALKIN
jgi:acetyltransferase-like isoleucine patch superfamily enzyme/glycosyltransferase involved in cell wall biosynthesis